MHTNSVSRSEVGEYINTPDLSCITNEDKKCVYEPAEDTFLLLDSLQKDCELIRHAKPSVVLEVGCGSGVVSVFMSKLLGKKQPACILCTDINRDAADLARRLAVNNRENIELVLTDLTSCLEEQLRSKVDILLFNPPYVVTPSEEVGVKDISAAWAGGIDGREVLNRLLPKVNQLLSATGVFYLVAVKENKTEEIERILYQFGFTMTVVMERRSGPELLKVLRFNRS